MEKNKLYPQHPSSVGADGMATVWCQFVKWVNWKIGHDETDILVAWNSKTCNLKWFWRLTQAPGSVLSMPDKIEFFLDPKMVICKQAPCM